MTIDTLREKLRHFGVEDDADFRFDREGAIYWYASDYHAGQSSDLYAVLCESGYQPGPMMSSGKLSGMAQEMYAFLAGEL